MTTPLIGKGIKLNLMIMGMEVTFKLTQIKALYIYYNDQAPNKKGI